MKDAAGRRVGRAGGLAFEDEPLPAALELGVGHGHGRAERLGVGVERVVKEGVAIGELDDLAEVHDGDAVRDVLDHAEVVGDKEIGEAQLGLEVLHQVDDLRLNGDVEGRDRLVTDDKVGVEREGAGDDDALALAAGELVGKALAIGGVEADQPEEFGDPILELLAMHEAMDDEGLGDDLADGMARVEGGVGILKDHLHAGAEPAQLVVVERRQVLAVEEDAAGGRRVELEDGAAGGRFAAAAFADEAEGLAAGNVERDAVDRFDEAGLAAEKAAGDGKVFLEVDDANERAMVRHRAASPAPDRKNRRPDGTERRP